MTSIEELKQLAVSEKDIIEALGLHFDSSTPFKNVINQQTLHLVQDLLIRQTMVLSKVNEEKRSQSGWEDEFVGLIKGV